MKPFSERRPMFLPKYQYSLKSQPTNYLHVNSSLQRRLCSAVGGRGNSLMARAGTNVSAMSGTTLRGKLETEVHACIGIT